MSDAMSTTRRIATGVLAAGAVGSAVLTGQLALSHAAAAAASTSGTPGTADSRDGSSGSSGDSQDQWGLSGGNSSDDSTQQGGSDDSTQQGGSGGFSQVPGLQGGSGRGSTSTRGS